MAAQPAALQLPSVKEVWLLATRSPPPSAVPAPRLAWTVPGLGSLATAAEAKVSAERAAARVGRRRLLTARDGWWVWPAAAG